VIWKVDRLARRTLDFLHADQALRDRKAGVVAWKTRRHDHRAGRAFATMLAVFAELEAEAISARVTAARATLLRSGRYVGGSVPYGWRSYPNPSGPGFVIEQDPDRIGYAGRWSSGHRQGAPSTPRAVAQRGRRADGYLASTAGLAGLGL
jgi:hypothetical protein